MEDNTTKDLLRPPDAGPTSYGSVQAPLRDFLLLLWANKWWVVLATAAAGAVAFVWTARQPKIYMSDCVMQYDPNPPRPLGSAVEELSGPFSFWMNREFYSTQNRIIGSRVVAERVVRKLGLTESSSNRESRTGFEGLDVDTASRRLQNIVSVEQENGTRLVHIRVTHGSPSFAASVANAVAESYIEKTMQDRLGNSIRALEWLQDQLETSRQQLDKSELKLHQFHAEHQDFAGSLEQDKENLISQRKGVLDEELTRAKLERVRLKARVDLLKDAVELGADAVHDEEIGTSSALGSLRTALRERQFEYASLSARYGPEHPRMIALEAEIRAAESQVKKELKSMVNTSTLLLRKSESIERGIREVYKRARGDELELNMLRIEYRKLRRARESRAKLHQILLERSTETDITRLLRVAHARVVDKALPPNTHVSPSLTKNSLLGLALGLMFSVFGVVLASRMGTRVISPDSVEKLGLTVLGVIPAIGAKVSKRGSKTQQALDSYDGPKELVVHERPRSAVAECCRAIRTNLAFASTDRKTRSILVTSSAPEDGKTTAAISIAITLAQTGKSVLLVDCDLRRPRLHRVFNSPPRKGLTPLLVTDADPAFQAHETDVPNLHLLPAGPVPPNPAELLHSHKFQDTLETLKGSYDWVVVDSPPLRPITDAVVLGPQLDGVIVVVRHAKTRKEAIRGAVRQLRDVNARLLGAVVNDLDLGVGGYYSHYYTSYYGGGYYYQEYTPNDESHDDDDSALSA